MATYEILAQQQATILAEDNSIIAYNKKSLVPTHKIKKILKSIRKFFKKPTVSLSSDASILEILPNEHQQPTVEINFFNEEEYDNLENERREAEMAHQ